MKPLRDFFLFQAAVRPDWSRNKKLLFRLWSLILPILASAGITAVMLLQSSVGHRALISLGYFTHPIIFLLNFIPVLLLMLLGIVITGRSWGGFIFSAVPSLALALGNYFKMSFRDDPVIFEDLASLVEAGKMAGNYSPVISVRMVILLLCALAGFALFILAARARYSPKLRLGILAALVLTVALGTKPYLSDKLYNGPAASNMELLNENSYTHMYISRGCMYPFLYSAKSAFPNPPEGYSKSESEEILSRYEDGDIPREQKVNIVGIMLEAFADLSEKFDSIEYARDVYALYHALEEESYSGELVTNIFAGGTVNTEWAFLTGCSTVYNWRGETASHVWHLKSQGYETSGDHPCYDWFYNRRNINSYLGFDSYRFVSNHYGDITGTIAMDDVFFPELTADLLTRLEREAPQFSFSVSYQGHGPYDTDSCIWGNTDDYVINNELDEAGRNILANYFGSLMDTQEHLCAMVDSLRELDEPVILVVFGDHMPWLGNGGSVYTALGANIDQSTQDGFYNYWTTPYLIWANDAAKEQLDFDFTGQGPDLSPCNLMGHLFDLLCWAGDSYTQATKDFRQTVTVVHDSGRYVENGVFTDTLSPEGEALLEEYRKLEYYRGR